MMWWCSTSATAVAYAVCALVPRRTNEVSRLLLFWLTTSLKHLLLLLGGPSSEGSSPLRSEDPLCVPRFT